MQKVVWWQHSLRSAVVLLTNGLLEEDNSRSKNLSTLLVWSSWAKVSLLSFLNRWSTTKLALRLSFQNKTKKLSAYLKSPCTLPLQQLAFASYASQTRNFESHSRVPRSCPHWFHDCCGKPWGQNSLPVPRRLGASGLPVYGDTGLLCSLAWQSTHTVQE